MSIASGKHRKARRSKSAPRLVTLFKTTRWSGNIRFLNVNQPIDCNFYPILQDLSPIGESHLCEMPLLPSVEWWRFLDEMVYSILSIMVCGRTWITSIVRPASFVRVLCHYVLRSLSASLMTELISGAAREAHHRKDFQPALLAAGAGFRTMLPARRRIRCAPTT
jgi:hypothetical protein